MTTSRPRPRSVLSRREWMVGMMAVPASMVIAQACSSDSAGTADSAAPSSTALSPPSAPTTSAGPAAPQSSGWAAGTTQLVTVAFPDDAVFDPTNTCELGSARELTEGPCYFAADAGPDISLGLDGLPTQLCLQFVDARCNPLVNRVVEVWHADRHGRYSGNTDNSGDAGRFDTGFCTEDHPDALATNAFRGQLTTNSSGRVDFVTCFPGWYPGRTIHFHYSVADNDSDRRFVSQLCFADTFADEICTDHELYRQRGTQDTPFSSDAVFSRDAVENYALSTRRNSDGTLLAYARIQIDA